MQFLNDHNNDANAILDNADHEHNVYHNRKQLQFLYRKYPNENGVLAKDRTFIGGIGTGKTTVLSTMQYLKALSMPRSLGTLIGCNYKQIVANLLPSIIANWGRLGLVEDIDFVVCKTPPKNWPKPIMGNKNYEHVISWSNGRGIGLMSADRKDLNRGSSFQDSDMDEAGLIKESFYNDIVAGRIRGERHRFGKSPFFEMKCQYSSMPFLASGMWVLNHKELARINPTKYYYQESTTADNIKVLGQAYLDRLKDAMDPYTYAREVLNERSKSSNAFYSALKEHVHLYENSISYVEHNIKSVFETAFKDADTNSLEPLNLSLDPGINFNCCTIYQYDKVFNVERCVNNFYVMKPLLLDDLVDKFIAYYTCHINKTVYLWGDRNSNKTEANNDQTLFNQVAKRLRDKGWKVKVMYFGKENPGHKLKHQFMNDLLKEETTKWPKLRISKEKALETYYSLHNSQGKEDYQKDKSMEKKLLNGSSRYMATDLGDTVDYYFWAKYYLGYKDKVNDFNLFNEV